MKNIEQKIIDYFLSEFEEEVDKNTVFFTDVNIYGDDGKRFMQTFSSEFHVNMDGFPDYDFFMDENEIINFTVWELITSIIKPSTKKWKTFGFLHLVDVVKCGFWFEP